METPEMSQSQRSKSLAGNKSQQKKKPTKFRNVLASVTVHTSVKLSESNSITFEEKFSELFQCTRPKKPKWNEVKNIPKEKRAAYRSSLQKPKHPFTRYLIFGINEVTRAIENDLCTLVLITSDVKPPILLRHIQQGCDTHQIPLVEVTDLRGITLKCFGFPAITVAFKDIPDELEGIREFLHLTAPDVIKNLCPDPKPRKVDEVKQEPPPPPPPGNNNSNEVGKKTVSFSENVYLLRENRKRRSFVPPPPASGGSEANVQHPMDFIELEGDNESVSSETDEHLYKNLRVKRVRANPNRLKGKKKN